LSKAIKHSFNKSFVVFSDFSRERSSTFRTSVQSHTNNGFFKLIMLLFTQEAIKYVAIRYQNSLYPCITCVHHSHAAKRLLP